MGNGRLRRRRRRVGSLRQLHLRRRRPGGDFDRHRDRSHPRREPGPGVSPGDPNKHGKRKIPDCFDGGRRHLRRSRLAVEPRRPSPDGGRPLLGCGGALGDLPARGRRSRRADADRLRGRPFGRGDVGGNPVRAGALENLGQAFRRQRSAGGRGREGGGDDLLPPGAAAHLGAGTAGRQLGGGVREVGNGSPDGNATVPDQFPALLPVRARRLRAPPVRHQMVPGPDGRRAGVGAAERVPMGDGRRRGRLDGDCGTSAVRPSDLARGGRQRRRFVRDRRLRKRGGGVPSVQTASGGARAEPGRDAWLWPENGMR